MQVTISEIRTFMECPAKWAFRYVARRAPLREPPDARTRGTIGHRAFERSVPENWGREQWLPFLTSSYIEECLASGYEPREDHFDSLEVLALRSADYWEEDG